MVESTTIRSLVIGFIIFTFVIVGTTYIISDLTTTNPDFLATDTEHRFSMFNNSLNKEESLKTSVANLENSVNQTGDLSGLTTGVFGVLKTTFTSFVFIKESITSISKIIGIPDWATILAALIVIVIIAFQIFSAVFQRDI